MIAKIQGCFGKFLAVVFTSIIAPVVVDMAVRDIHGEGTKPAAEARPSSLKEETPRSPSPSSAPLSPGEVVCVIAQGTGWTSEEAIRDALRTALLQALAARVDANTWSRQRQTLGENILQDSGRLILDWKELGSRKEWRLRGIRYHEEIAVRVNGRALAERLRVVQAPRWDRPSE